MCISAWHNNPFVGAIPAETLKMERQIIEVELVRQATDEAGVVLTRRNQASSPGVLRPLREGRRRMKTNSASLLRLTRSNATVGSIYLDLEIHGRKPTSIDSRIIK